jgi:hypothetical protein
VHDDDGSLDDGLGTNVDHHRVESEGLVQEDEVPGIRGNGAEEVLSFGVIGKEAEGTGAVGSR